MPIDHELPGRWRVTLITKEPGIRAHKAYFHPPHHSSMYSEGRDWFGCQWWAWRTVRDLKARGGRVVSLEFRPTKEE